MAHTIEERRIRHQKANHKYTASNRGKITSKQYREANHAHISEYGKERYTWPGMKDKKQAESKAWRTKNPHRMKEYREQPEVKAREKAGKVRRKKNDPLLDVLRNRVKSANRKAKELGVSGVLCINDITNHLNRVISQRGRLECECCGKEVFLLGGKDVSFEIDHIIPMSRGGCNIRNNLQILCGKCNRKKFNYLPSELSIRESL